MVGVKRILIKQHGTYYDEEGFNIKGYDKDGYNKSGYDEHGYNREGYSLLGYDKEGYDKEGYDINGYDKRKFDRNGIHKRTKSIYDPIGYDREGYNKKGYDINGYDRYGYSKIGYDKEGYNIDGYNLNGVNRYGINKKGFGKDGFYYEKQEDGTWKNTGKTRDLEGFDANGINERGFDRNGLFYKKLDNGTWQNTYSIYDLDGYDINNYNENGFSREESINRQGFDREGFYHKKDENGNFVSTELKYNEAGFTMNGQHLITKSKVDLRRFDINGKCKANNDSIYDKQGFKQDGTYMETGEKYHNGYNAFGLDKDGKDKKGKIHPDITFTQGYIKALMNGNRLAYLKETCGLNQSNKGIILNDTNIRVYRATEMYPELKKIIAVQVVTLRRAIKQREKKIEELEGKTASEKEEIKKLQYENKILKERIASMDPMQEIEK